MTPALLAVLTAAALTLLGVLLAVAAVVNGNRRTRHALAESRAEVDALRTRLEQLETIRRTTVPPVVQSEYVITTAGEPEAGGGADVARAEPTVSDRVVLSAAFGEPLVKLVSLAYGVRQALSAENRNRIGFEMRREVKRARKVRRREAREARRDLRTAQRAELVEEGAA